MWTSVIPASAEAKVPTSRSKHASVLHGQHLYLLGGRNGNVPLKDFWKYHIAENVWELIDKSKGDSPGCLQEHSIVGYKDVLYVFGGEVGFSNGVETPLWMYHINKNEWRKFRAPKGVQTPKGRRSHTATVFQDSLYIYGGYQDLKGSSSELWSFHFVSETWHLISQGGSDVPSPRHRHTAVLHDNAMWVYGGMNDLQEKSDFWRFDFVSRKWRLVRSKPGPGCLHSQCAVKFLSVMMLFGGERDGQALNDMWRFHFATEFWEKLTFPTPTKPMPRAQTTAFILSQFKTRGAVHYLGLSEQNYCGSQPDPEKRTIITKDSPVKDSEALYEEIDDCKVNTSTTVSKDSNTYTFNDPNNCLFEEEEEIEDKLTSTKKIYEKLPLMRSKQTNFQRMVEPPPASNVSMKAKYLSKMPLYSSYSMFSNESNESLNVTEDKTADTTLASPAMESPSSVKLNFSMKKSQSMVSTSSSSKASSTGSVIPRDKSLQSFTQALIHTDPTNNQENIYETVEDNNKSGSVELVDLGKSKRSDSAYTFQSYEGSSRSSTLSSAVSSAFNKPLMGTRVLPPRNHRLVDVEYGESKFSSANNYYSGDELSSSGYESIEANINCISNKKPSTSTALTSFSNPNYLCPDAKTVGEKQQKNKFGETIIPPICQLSRDESHQNFAAALNSPAESLISDYQDFHARLNHDLVEMNPTQSLLSSNKATVMKISTFGNTSSSSASKSSSATPVVPRRKPRPVSMSGAEIMAPQVTKPCKTPYSDDDESMTSKLNNSRNSSGQPTNNDNGKNQLSLMMYVIGGRVGQVTVFNGPISLWKLDLTKTF